MSRPTLFCLTGDAEPETLALLQAACDRLGVTWQPLAAGPDAEALLTSAAHGLVLVAGTDPAGEDLVNRLWHPGLVSLQGLGQAAGSVDGDALQAAGVRLPLRVSPAPRDADTLAAAAHQLAAWPVLLRLPDGEGGHGVMRVDSLPSLVSVRHALPDEVDLVEYVPHTVAWRVVIVGNAVVAAEAWRPAAHDFRSNVGGQLASGLPRPPEVDRMALAAARLLGLQFAGVDVMQGDDGAVCVAEVNSPCYFAGTQQRSSVDIAGLIVQRLLDLQPAPR